MVHNAADGEGKRIGAIERSFTVLKVLRQLGTVRINDVAEELDIPTNTAHVHLKTLESSGTSSKTTTDIAEAFASSVTVLQSVTALASTVSRNPN